MKNNPMLKDFYELTALEVYSKKERAICDVMKQKLTALGLEVEEDDTAEKTGSECGNIIAVLKGDPKVEPILFSCHLDRVPNNGHIQPQLNEEERIMYSDKKTILAADDVSGICVMLQALVQNEDGKWRTGAVRNTSLFSDYPLVSSIYRMARLKTLEGSRLLDEVAEALAGKPERGTALWNMINGKRQSSGNLTADEIRKMLEEIKGKL